MRHKGERITTLGALLDAMTIESGSRKTYAVIHYYPPDTCKVDEHFDLGIGHSSSFPCDTAEIDIAVFEEAKAKGYVTGRLEPGEVSKTDFVLTRNTDLRQKIWPIVRAWQEKDYFNKHSQYDVKHGKPGTYIKIVKVQDSGPEEAREALLGEVLPCRQLDGKYAVSQQYALQLLADEQPESAAKWREQLLSKGEDDVFIFSSSEVEEFAGAFAH